MEKLIKIKELVEKMSVDTEKAYKKGNKSAAIRARRYAQEIKDLITPFRKDVLNTIKNYNKNGMD